ncbi:molybdopterin biosynthesis protein [Pedobacter frigiditerrae]|uniref:Molybdopterin-synthase adenylyltransferase n=1 Tax=Pedobacter frigiditerrae TaxID=2530452 RepID=A0A4R0MSZ6_9SPHI|nr:HesA/MoeB/ThiF family protein [Pedobacter frigiditerrae]TCC90138.1 molybdopterin biosynthesis protein [Pedobacter frigiditerrae]
MASERYHRQLILEGFGASAQSKLTAAKVLVIGAGGLGCPALQYLAAAGVGLIGIADDDTVALSNLHRQILYTTNDIGRLKAKVAALRLHAMNPEIEFVVHVLRIETNNVLEILKDYDFVLDGSDNFESRYLINDACALLKKPLIFAAVADYEGQLAIFNATDEKGETTNYRDLFPIAPKPGEIANCADNGVIGVLPGIMGTMAASETIKLITGIGRPLINKLLHYNILSNEQYELAIIAGNDYQLPQNEADLMAFKYNHISLTEPMVIEIDATTLKDLQQKTSTLLIDVREIHEVPALDQAIYRQVPMSSFNDFLSTDVEAQNIVLICQHGIRSVAAAEALSEKYGNTKNIYSLKGGIVKWRNYFIN